MIITTIIACLKYSTDYGRNKKFQDEYTLSKEILKDDRWRNCGNAELNMWYRAITRVMLDSRIIKHMFKSDNPLLILTSYAEGIQYIQEKTTEDNQIEISFNKKWMIFWQKDWEWHMRYNTLLYCTFTILGLSMFILMNYGASSLLEAALYFIAAIFPFSIAFIYPLNEIWKLRAAKRALDFFKENPIKNNET
ncbi:hypothetical protein [Desulfovibrio sp. JC010]|uniref:hypothetical protein n=1 Tax=Desulfovibrio sp. JC010 TaxID=2593641 RepID=UPI0013D504E0|nr:hypothetical protein [Desulfovibrio sp. JC010]NDV28113.1 hypothetical protein [Desulfovibrio sp. JC010]